MREREARQGKGGEERLPEGRCVTQAQGNKKKKKGKANRTNTPGGQRAQSNVMIHSTGTASPAPKSTRYERLPRLLSVRPPGV